MLFAFGVIVLVLAHSGKDAGLSGAFGVGSSGFGSTQIMERNLTRFTVACRSGSSARRSPSASCSDARAGGGA